MTEHKEEVYTIDNARIEIDTIAEELAKLRLEFERHEHKPDGSIVYRKE